MTLYKILHYPNPKLRLKAEKVTAINQDIQRLIDDMFETMYEDNGCGLAAPQINIQKCIVVIDMSHNQTDPIVLINPEIIAKSGSHTEAEGCLSLPGIFEKVTRAGHVKVKALDRYGKEFEIEGDNNYLGACLQHELDHLEGELLIDRLSMLKQQLVKKKFKKIHKKMF